MEGQQVREFACRAVALHAAHFPRGCFGFRFVLVVLEVVHVIAAKLWAGSQLKPAKPAQQAFP